MMRKLLYFCWICMFSIDLAYSQSTTQIKSKSEVPGFSPSLFYYVVIYRDAFGLPDYIVDTLNARASEAKIRLISNPDFDVREFERKIVRSLLSDDQYCNLLVLKNRPIAAELTSKVWSEMLQQQLVSDSDYLKYYGRINAHLLTSLLTREYFSDYHKEQQKYLKELEKKAPSPLYEYYHHGYDKPYSRNPYRAEFLW